MASKLPSQALRRAQTSFCTSSPHTQQIRHASLLRRPHRPYTFTQLITLSDGSTYTVRTTSPSPMFRSTKDTRNHPMWQPSLDSLRNVEQDEAGKLRAFRKKFGRGWDLDGEVEGEEGAEREGGVKAEGAEKKDGDVDSGAGGSLMDLISNAAGGEQTRLGAKGKKGKM